MGRRELARHSVFRFAVHRVLARHPAFAFPDRRATSRRPLVYVLQKKTQLIAIKTINWVYKLNIKTGTASKV
ncbi:hypothetical protein ACTQ5R_04445 [Ruoffia tabacinasalis]|uniref:hypothetical protein n=1 Tax=Ruoffia tabacinasalis TaxID=87458 RepID=UPI003F96081F